VLPKNADSETAAEIDAYINALAEMNRFSGAVLVARQGHVVLSKGYGMANHEHDVPNTPQTVFRIGSLSKQFTAMAIMLLHEAGHLRVEDTVAQYLPDYPHGAKITIHHLLTHSSGLPREAGLPTAPMVLSTEQVVELVKAKPLEFEPGTHQLYSNAGYQLLAYLIEKASGKPYAAFLAKNIFQPLGMSNTGQDSQHLVLKHRASGYAWADGQIIKVEFENIQNSYGSGNLYSTVEDLYRWDQALYTGKPVSEMAQDAMFENHYGVGKHQVLEHTGIAAAGRRNGFNAYLARFVDDRVTIIFLTNFDEVPLVQMMNDLPAILFGADYEMPKSIFRKAVAINPEIYDHFTGEYQLAIDSSQTFYVVKEDDRLFLVDEGEKKELFPESETDFFAAPDSEDTFVFVRNEKDQVTQMTITMLGGMDLVAKKII